MRNATAALELYLYLRDEALPSIPARRPGEIAQVPNTDRTRCPLCREKTQPAWKISRNHPNGHWACGHCGASWPTRKVCEAISVSIRARSPKERDQALLHLLARPLESLKLWERRTLVGYAQASRLIDTLRNLPEPKGPEAVRARRHAIETLTTSLGRSPTWERKLVGSCAEVLGGLEDEREAYGRKVEVLAAAFPRAFPRAAGAPRTSYAVRKELGEAREQYENAMPDVA